MVGKLAALAVRSIVDNARRAGTSEILRQTLAEVERRAAPAEAPSGRRVAAVARLGYAGFLFCIVLTIASVLGFLAISSKSDTLAWARIGMGTVLFLEGGALLWNWGGTRRLVAAHLRSRHGAGAGLLGSLLWRSTSGILAIAGFAWLCLGMLAVGLGLSGVFG